MKSPRLGLPGLLLILLATTPAWGAKRQHRVRQTETLSLLSRLYGCTKSEIFLANRDKLSSPDNIRTGQLLTIPECKDNAGDHQKVHIVRRGESAWRIARKYGCTTGDLTPLNAHIGDLKRLKAGDAVFIPWCTQSSSGSGSGSSSSFCAWKSSAVDSKRLKAKMLARGFVAPAEFRALVVKINLSGSGQSSRILRQRAFDYGGKSDEKDHWNPASTVKIFPAIATLELLERRGLPPDAKARFAYRKPETFSVAKLIHDAVSPSDNIAYDRLVQLVGFSELNGEQGFFARHGFEYTNIMAAYAQDKWNAAGHSSSFRSSPAVELRHGSKIRRLPARKGDERPKCYKSVCTTLGDLSRCMCRVMLHEQLAKMGVHTFGISREVLQKGIRLNLMGKASGDTTRHRGMNVVRGLSAAFPEETRFFNKPGFARDWFSDVVYIYLPHKNERWIVAMAGYPGRNSLDDAARIIGKIIATGEL